MKLEQSFEVDAPLERVWQTLIDVEHVAPCLPGAAVTGRNEDGSYNGTFTVKIGPTTASYTGRLEMENIDEGSHTAVMQAQGTDKRGQGGAKATIQSRLAPADGRGTRVEVVTDYHITGRLARFGRGGMIEDISERLLREFAKRLQSSLAAQQETIVSEAPASEPEAPVAPVAPAAEPEPPRDHTVFAPVPSDGAPPEAPAPPSYEAPAPPAESEAPAPAEEPVAETPPSPPEYEFQPWATPSQMYDTAVPEPTDPASGPPPEAPPEPPAPVGEPAATGPAATGPAAAEPLEPPAPPPPPSPGPPPVTTPPPAPSAPPVGERPPLQHPPQPNEPMQGLSLVGDVLWNRVKRNPAPAAAAGVAVMLLLARRRRRRR
ncbi:MAG: SRPBCC family protein [Solirubrobacterales bacterium]|nr:SRPBCC family protein [Solirubrobacterales bacterium]